MDSYSNKINRIKYTIDEIRDDIEKMKMVNNIYNSFIIYLEKRKNDKYDDDFYQSKKCKFKQY
jgi:hypothetical protein